MYLLDTVVVSALRRQDRFPQVAGWVRKQRTADLFLSVISVGEIEKGIARQRTADPAFADTLAAWLDWILSVYGDRILPFDLGSARRWGRLCATVGNESADLMLAATALEHGLTVATRNLSDFTPTGVAVINPFDPPRRR
ncbi:type II toxin-antitoxin system VapC family toxin [Elioraea sp.]|uniref:type II toxin-antitoxin system VapC family toxin n=1 Tax=Elioraea sp. TaxID=2185103 RepID=UPI00307E7515